MTTPLTATSVIGVDNVTYTKLGNTISVTSSTLTNSTNYYGNVNIVVANTITHGISCFTVSAGNTISSFTNSGIILGGGGAGGQGNQANTIPASNGGDGISNFGTITTFYNYGAFLGGGGGGNGGNGGFPGGAGGGGGGGGNTNLGGQGGSMVGYYSMTLTSGNASTANGQNTANYETGGGGGGPGGRGGNSINNGGSIIYYEGIGGGTIGGYGGPPTGNGYNSPIDDVFIFGGGGGGGGTDAGGAGGYGMGYSTHYASGGGGGGGMVNGYVAGGSTPYGGNGGYSINNQGNITTFSNSQGGTGYLYGPLFYNGRLPTNYYIIINSATRYGQLYGNLTSSSSTLSNFNIDSTSTLPLITTDGLVLRRVVHGFTVNSSSLTGTFTKTAITYKWKLIQNNVTYTQSNVSSTITIPSTGNIVAYDLSMNVVGSDNLIYSLTNGFVNDTTNTSNYCGVNNGGNTYTFTSSIASFTNNYIVLAAGGYNGQHGGSGVYNTGTIKNFYNYGAFLGGGGGDGTPSNAAYGAAGGGGSGGYFGIGHTPGTGGGLVTNNNIGSASIVGTRSGASGGGPGNGAGGPGIRAGGAGGTYNTNTGLYRGVNGNQGGETSSGGGGGYGGGNGGLSYLGNGMVGSGGGGGGSGRYNGGYSIFNSGNITNLYNSQGGNNRYGPLFYAGKLPNYYNIKINSASSYGQLSCTGWGTSTGSMEFGIDHTSNLTVGVYKAVLVGVTPLNTSSRDLYTWDLVLNTAIPGLVVYDLSFSSVNFNTVINNTVSPTTYTTFRGASSNIRFGISNSSLIKTSTTSLYLKTVITGIIPTNLSGTFTYNGINYGWQLLVVPNSDPISYNLVVILSNMLTGIYVNNIDVAFLIKTSF